MTVITDALTRFGELTSGSVESFELEGEEGSWSRHVRLHLRYSDSAAGRKPSTLRLKIVGEAGPESSAFGRSEVDYLTHDYAALPDAPIPVCYDARYAENPRRYHLLMEDLSDTHRNSFGVTPTEPYARALAEALAILHAPYWGRFDAGPIEAAIDQYIAHIRPGLAPLLTDTGGELAAEQRAVLESLFDWHPARMRQRAHDPQGLTLVHGDVNPGNVLTPNEFTGAGRLYIVDRQPFDWSLIWWLGVSDLAYASVHWWEPDERRALEVPMLRRYHETLMARGVTGYSWQQLWDDYRLSAVQSLYVAVEWCVKPEDVSRMRWLWRGQLHKALTAYADLDCEALRRTFEA